jgi:hypothetical protein
VEVFVSAFESHPRASKSIPSYAAICGSRLFSVYSNPAGIKPNKGQGRTDTIQTLFCLLALVCGASLAFAENSLAPVPWQQKTFTSAFAPKHTFPRVANGFVISVRHTRSHDTPDAILLNSLKDGAQRQIPFWLPDATQVSIEDATVTPDQRLLVFGSVSRADSSVRTNYISQLDLQGHVLSTFSTDGYEPQRACSSGNGTIWTIGQDWMAEIQGRSYAILRNYSASGELLRSYLQRAELPVTDLNLSARLAKQGGTHGRAFVVCGANMVGAYFGPGHTWVSIRLSDGTAHVWHVRSPAEKNKMRVTGLALLRDTVYASFASPDPQQFLPKFSVQRLDLSQEQGAWKPVVLAGTAEVDESTHAFDAILGSDGSSLVYANKQGPSAKTQGVLFWVKP